MEAVAFRTWTKREAILSTWRKIVAEGPQASALGTAARYPARVVIDAEEPYPLSGREPPGQHKAAERFGLPGNTA